MTHFTQANAPNHTDDERAVMNDAVETQLLANEMSMLDINVSGIGWKRDIYEAILADVLRGMEKEAT